MKQLLVIRHAKSSWDFSVLNDFDRALNERGRHDAPMMANRLLKKKIEIDAFISSTANRALTTASYFFDVYKKNKNKLKADHIIEVPELYHASRNIFYEVISKTADSFDTIAVFSHNPGITSFVNELTSTKIDDMPTCGIFGVQIKTKSWKDFAPAEKKFWFFDYPKS